MRAEMTKIFSHVHGDNGLIASVVGVGNYFFVSGEVAFLVVVVDEFIVVVIEF